MSPINRSPFLVPNTPANTMLEVDKAGIPWWPTGTVSPVQSESLCASSDDPCGQTSSHTPNNRMVVGQCVSFCVWSAPRSSWRSSRTSSLRTWMAVHLQRRKECTIIISHCCNIAQQRMGCDRGMVSRPASRTMIIVGQSKRDRWESPRSRLLCRSVLQMDQKI